MKILIGFIAAIALLTPSAYADFSAYKDNVTLVTFHHIANVTQDMTTTVANFDSFIGWLHQNNFTCMTSKELVNAMLDGKLISERSAVITLDDGWKSQMNAIPVLDKYGCKASFYMIGNSLQQDGSGAYLNKTQVKMLSDLGHEIGAHSMNHDTVNDHDWDKQVRQTKDLIESSTGVIVETWAYPNCYKTTELDNALRLYGLKGAVMCETSGSAFHNSGIPNWQDTLAIPRQHADYSWFTLNDFKKLFERQISAAPQQVTNSTRLEWESFTTKSGSTGINDRQLDSVKDIDLSTVGWLEHTVILSEGAYDLHFRIKTGDWSKPTVSLSKYVFYLDGQPLMVNGSYSLVQEPTCSCITWGSVSARNISVAAGTHKIRAETKSPWGTFDYVELQKLTIVATNDTIPDPIPQPEEYVNVTIPKKMYDWINSQSTANETWLDTLIRLLRLVGYPW